LTILPLVIQRLGTVGTLEKDVSFLERRDNVLLAMEMFRRHPVFGVGLGSFPAVWHNYIPADYPTYFAQYHEPTRLRFPDFGYVQILCETGIVGLVVFLAIIGSGARAAWRQRRAALARADGFAVNLSALTLTLVLFVAVSTLLQDAFLYVRVWLIYALVVLMNDRVLAAKSAPGPEPAA
jgi:O-antigen ligase